MVGENPDHVARKDPVRGVPFKALHLFGKAGHFTSPFLVLLGFLFGRLFRRPWRDDLFLALVFFLNLLLVCVLLWGYRYASLRHVLAATVLTLPLCGRALVELWLLAAWRVPILFRGLILLWALAFTILFCVQGMKPLRYNRKHLRPVGAIVRSIASPGDLMLSEDPRLAFYAGTGYLALGMTDAASLTREARERGIRFLVSERDELKRRVPDFGEAVRRGDWRKIDLSGAGSWPGIEPVAFELRGR